MKRIKLTVLALVSVISLAGCGGNSQSDSSQSAESSNSKVRESAVSIPLKFSLSPDSSVPYACQEIFQQGTLCTLDVLFENTGNDVFDYDLSVRAIDDQGRTYAPQTDLAVPQISTGGTSFINPGEKLMWSMEFSVSPGTRLTSVQIYQSLELVAIVPIDLQG